MLINLIRLKGVEKAVSILARNKVAVIENHCFLFTDNGPTQFMYVYLAVEFDLTHWRCTNNI